MPPIPATGVESRHGLSIPSLGSRTVFLIVIMPAGFASSRDQTDFNASLERTPLAMSDTGSLPTFVDGRTVGIDLGTSYSAIAHLGDSGNPEVMNNSNDSPITASIVVLGENGKITVGPTVDVLDEAGPSRVVIAIKREMGNPRFAMHYQNRRMTPELISSLILMKLKIDAEKQIGTIGNAVITVPYYFNEPRRAATRYAGKIAGLNVLDIINEPTAATLAYAWTKGELGQLDMPDVTRTILVYDLGGGTFDVTIVRYTPTQFNVLATDGDTMLGGLDWTARILDYACDRFVNKHGVDPRQDAKARFTLMRECEAAKRELSHWSKTKVELTFRGQDMSVDLSRAEFEQLTSDLLQRTRDTTEFILDNHNVSPDDLDEVLLVGGSTAMPGVVEMLEKLTRRKPSRVLNPQLAVAEGAAIHSAILEAKATDGKGRMSHALLNRLRAVTTTDVNSHSLGVEISDPKNPNKKRNHIMIPRNSPLPCGTKQQFVTVKDQPQSITIKLLEGDAPQVSGCTFIGDVRINDLPSHLPVGSPVEVIYSYDHKGHINVAVKELTGGRSAAVEIAWEGALDNQAIETLRTLTREYHIE